MKTQSRQSQRYQDYIQSQAWSELKRAAWARYGKTCQVCGEESVQVHHLVYRRNIEDGEVGDLMPLCVPCHQGVHRYQPVCQRLRKAPQDPETRRAIIILSKDELMAWGRKNNDSREHAYPAYPSLSDGSTYIAISEKQSFAVCDRLAKRKSEREAFFGTVMAGLMQRNRLKKGGAVSHT